MKWTMRRDCQRVVAVNVCSFISMIYLLHSFCLRDEMRLNLQSILVIVNLCLNWLSISCITSDGTSRSLSRTSVWWCRPCALLGSTVAACSCSGPAPSSWSPPRTCSWRALADWSPWPCPERSLCSAEWTLEASRDRRGWCRADMEAHRREFWSHAACHSSRAGWLVWATGRRRRRRRRLALYTMVGLETE